jgi:hypothetical protein
MANIDHQQQLLLFSNDTLTVNTRCPGRPTTSVTFKGIWEGKLEENCSVISEKFIVAPTVPVKNAYISLRPTWDVLRFLPTGSIEEFQRVYINKPISQPSVALRKLQEDYEQANAAPNVLTIIGGTVSICALLAQIGIFTYLYCVYKRQPQPTSPPGV